jgi:hypothetical protein
MIILVLTCAAIASPFLLIESYKLKCKLNINLLPGSHTPDLIEKYSIGIIKSKWFN